PRETVNGVDVHRLPVEHRRGSALRYAWEYLAFALLAFLKVTQLHLRKRLQVVEVDNMPDILVFSSLIAKLTGAKVILYVFDNMPDLYAYLRQVSDRHPVVRLLTFLEILSAKFADRVVVTQEFPRRMAVARGVLAEKITVVLNCADENTFKRRRSIGQTPNTASPDRPFMIATHGVILERYGIQVLIDAMPIIAREIPQAQVQVFGEGEFRSELEEQARRNGVSERVHFRGFAPLNELLSTLAQADAGYVGMLNDLVLPNKLMEYVSTGVPVILSRWPTFEYYFPETAATYFEAGNAEHLAEAIIWLYRNPEEARARAERASDLYKQYRWPVQREVYLGVYSDLRAEPRAGRQRSYPLEPIS
ncbi:MAG: glycosyltransferase, partial [Chloroflexota bacterium]|nr:glycosyltransferase [Chloroflexota bacterium]